MSKFQARTSKQALPDLNPSRIRAFTLIEIILVLALIGLLFSLFIGISGTFARASKEPEPPIAILRAAVLEATHLSSKGKEVTHLRFDDENGTLVIENAAGTQLSVREFDDFVVQDGDERELLFTVSFEAETPLQGVSGDEGEWDDEDLSLRRVTFHPSGVSTPFLARLIHHDTDKEEVLRFDPFSGYVLFEEEEEE